MIRRHLPLLVLWVLVAMQAIEAWRYGARLPDRVASHFGANGAADGFMDRTAFLLVFAGLALFVAALFTGIAWLLPRMPPRWVNLPHKDHWLAPDRAEATFRRLNATLLWIGSLTLVLLLMVFHLTVQANQRQGQPRLGSGAALVVAGFGIATLMVLVVGLWPFLRSGSSAKRRE